MVAPGGALLLFALPQTIAGATRGGLLCVDGSTTTAEDLTERVRQVKPHFSAATILARVEEMGRKGWLKSIAGGDAGACSNT